VIVSYLLVIVALFIFILYGTWGVLANVALLIHTILTFSALTLVGATLTRWFVAPVIGLSAIVVAVAAAAFRFGPQRAEEPAG